MAETGTFRLRRISRSAGLVAAGTILATVGLISLAIGAASSTGAACTGGAAGPGEIFKNVDTTAGCDAPDGTMGMPVTGWITVHMPDGVSTAAGADVIEANVKGGGHPYYPGDYDIAFTTVVGGTATGGSYSMAPTDVQYPDDPPVTKALAFTSTLPGGVVQAQYMLAWTGTEPVAHDSIASLTNDLFVWFGDSSRSTQVRTESVKPFTPANPTPTPTPTPTTPTATPTPTPTGGTQGLSTPTPTGMVQGIHTPVTGGGPGSGDGGSGVLLLALGSLTVLAGLTVRRAEAHTR